MRTYAYAAIASLTLLALAGMPAMAQESAPAPSAIQYLAEVQQVTPPADSKDVAAWRAKLDDQVLKLIAAGHMAPWRVQPGETESMFYFSDPLDLILTLSRAKPYMTPEVAQKAGEYLDKEMAAYPPASVALMPRDQGKYRELYDLSDKDRSFRWQRWTWRSLNARPRMMAFYALWNYAEAFGRWEAVEKQYPALVLLFDEQLNAKTNLLEEVAGLAGFARIADHMGDVKRAEKARSAAVALLGQLKTYDEMNKRARDRYDGEAKDQSGQNLRRQIQPALFNLVPESARFLADTQKPAVAKGVSSMIGRFPLWHIPMPPNYETLFGEGCSIAPDNKPNIFLARAMILGEPAGELANDLDIPWIPVGDLFYMQCLTSLIESAGTRGWTPYAAKAKGEFGPKDEAGISQLREDRNAQKTAGWKVTKLADKGPASLGTIDEELASALPDSATAGKDWKDAKLELVDGTLDLKKLFGGGDPKDVVGYAWTRVYAPAKTACVLMVRNDEGLAVWINKARVLQDAEGAGWMPGEVPAPATLEAGWNTVLLKLRQGGGDWKFTAHFTTPGGAPIEGLKFSADPADK